MPRLPRARPQHLPEARGSPGRARGPDFASLKLNGTPHTFPLSAHTRCYGFMSHESAWSASRHRRLAPSATAAVTAATVVISCASIAAAVIAAIATAITAAAVARYLHMVLFRANIAFHVSGDNRVGFCSLSPVRWAWVCSSLPAEYPDLGCSAGSCLRRSRWSTMSPVDEWCAMGALNAHPRTSALHTLTTIGLILELTQVGSSTIITSTVSAVTAAVTTAATAAATAATTTATAAATTAAAAVVVAAAAAMHCRATAAATVATYAAASATAITAVSVASAVTAAVTHATAVNSAITAAAALVTAAAPASTAASAASAAYAVPPPSLPSIIAAAAAACSTQAPHTSAATFLSMAVDRLTL